MTLAFPLESVLRLRISQEQQEQALLETIARRLQRAQDRCESLKKEKLELDERALAQLMAGMTSEDVRFWRARKARLEQAEDAAARALVEVSKEWNAQRLRFLEARRDREAISKVRRREHEASILHKARREQQQIDDLFAAGSRS